jgi:hypothetical protein
VFGWRPGAAGPAVGRHHGILGRLEVTAGDLERALAREAEIVAAIRGAGYAHAVIDREPFRSGRLNVALPVTCREAPRHRDEADRWSRPGTPPAARGHRPSRGARA